MLEIKGKFSTAKVMIDNLEPSCISQIVLFTNHPAFTNPIRIMPDAHTGRGSCIGFSMEMTDKIVPQVVGVDISCGMLSFNIGKTVPVSLQELDNKIRLRIPFGMEVHEKDIIHMKNDFPWKEANSLAQGFAVAYQEKFNHQIDLPKYTVDWFLDKCNKIGGGARRIINSIGTVGGGNHFVELGISDSGDHWVTIHSGSRNFGKRICDYWQNLAVKRIRRERMQAAGQAIQEAKKTLSGKELYEKIKQIKSEANPGINLTGLEWLEGEDAAGYLYDMIFSQVYAKTNREYMARIICDILKVERQDQIETIHNFIDFKDFIIRKGAVRSYGGERFILPFNMRDGILICEGKSCSDWNFSAPHGAGRVMSRSQARKNLDVQKFKDQMQGIYSTSVDRSTIDEAPDAYKDCKIIEAAIEPTAKIIGRIKPIHNMKDSSEFHQRRRKWV